jgi:GTP-binding protein YchF
MGFKMGIVGLPNVGKSTLFNALTRTAAAQAANFPFCTIEPNVGEVAVPDGRLEKLAAIAGSKQIIPTRMTFVDIAGLVKGASKGEGLGNQFLANIREVDAIAHVLRCFEDGDVTHVEGRVDPVADAEVIETELMLADLDSIEKRRAGLVRKLKGGDKEAVQADRLLGLAQAALEEGRPARTVEIDDEDLKAWKMLQLLTSKPVLYVCNVEESNAAEGNAHSQAVAEMAAAQGAGSVVISAQIEEEISQLEPDEAFVFLEEMGLEEAGLDRLIRAGYELLHLETYFTVGPKEARAWTIPSGTPAPKAAGMHASLLGFCLESLILGDDLIGQALRCTRGIEVDEDTLSVEVIRAACIGGPGHYLGSAQTLGRMQTDYVYPSLANRFSPKEWDELGKPDLIEKATEKKMKILSERSAARFDPITDRAIRERFRIHLPA